MIKGNYKGIDYEINNNEKGSSYSIFERTPITYTKCELSFGYSCKQEDFTEDYVKNVINNMLERTE